VSTTDTGKRFCLFLGDGFDDIEAVALIDLLRRAGVAIDIHGVGRERIRSYSGLEYTADFAFREGTVLDVRRYDGILLPGGPGVANLLSREGLIQAIREFHAAGKLIYAICGAPLLLDKAGVLGGRRFTCLPSVAPRIASGSYCEADVVRDGNIVTSKALGTSIDGALALIEAIVSPAKKEEIRSYFHIRTASSL
jgi:protein deglycase